MDNRRAIRPSLRVHWCNWRIAESPRSDGQQAPMLSRHSRRRRTSCSNKRAHTAISLHRSVTTFRSRNQLICIYMLLNGSRFLLVVLLVGSAACSEERRASASDSAVESRPDENPMTVFRTRLNRTWELARLGSQDIPAPATRPREQRPGRHPGPGTRPTIRFTSDPPGSLSDGTPGLLSASGWSFCNGYGTAYALGPGDQLRFRGFQSTLVGCDGPDSLETRFFRALGSTRRFAFDSSALHLIAEDGSRLIFIAAPEGTKSQ